MDFLVLKFFTYENWEQKVYQYWEKCRISRNWVRDKAAPNSCSYRVQHNFFLHGVGKIKILKVSKWTRKTEASKNSWCFIQSFRNSNQRYWKVCLNCLLLWKRRIESSWNEGAAVTNKNQLLPPDEKSILISWLHFHSNQQI